MSTTDTRASGIDDRDDLILLARYPVSHFCSGQWRREERFPPAETPGGHAQAGEPATKPWLILIYRTACSQG
jgi:hypothetical protein